MAVGLQINFRISPVTLNWKDILTGGDEKMTINIGGFFS